MWTPPWYYLSVLVLQHLASSDRGREEKTTVLLYPNLGYHTCHFCYSLLVWNELKLSLMFERKGIRCHFLKGGVLSKLWTYLKIVTAHNSDLQWCQTTTCDWGKSVLIELYTQWRNYTGSGVPYRYGLTHSIACFQAYFAVFCFCLPLSS